jgi:hypothetical protein
MAVVAAQVAEPPGQGSIFMGMGLPSDVSL